MTSQRTKAKVIPMPLRHDEDVRDLSRRLAVALYSFHRQLGMDYALKHHIPQRVDLHFEAIARDLLKWFYEDTDYDPFLAPVTQGSQQPPR